LTFSSGEGKNSNFFSRIELVDQNSASWNRTVGWLRQLDALETSLPFSQRMQGCLVFARPSTSAGSMRAARRAGTDASVAALTTSR